MTWRDREFAELMRGERAPASHVDYHDAGLVAPILAGVAIAAAGAGVVLIAVALWLRRRA